MSEVVYKYMNDDQIGFCSGIEYAKKHDKVRLIDDSRDMHLVENEKNGQKFFVWPSKLTDNTPTKEEIKAASAPLIMSAPAPNTKRRRR